MENAAKAMMAAKLRMISLVIAGGIAYVLTNDAKAKLLIFFTCRSRCKSGQRYLKQQKEAEE